MSKLTEQMKTLLGGLARLSTEANAKSDAYINYETGEGWVSLGDYEVWNYNGEIWYNYEPLGAPKQAEYHIDPSRIESFTEPPKAKTPLPPKVNRVFAMGKNQSIHKYIWLTEVVK